MDAPKHEIRPGQVEITLVGFPNPLVLTPSLRAATTLSRRYGGLKELVDKVQAFDVEAFIAIIGASAGLAEAGLAKLPDAVFDTGVLNIAVPLMKFCTSLANGGRPIGEDAPEGPSPSL
jgi:hypothetical protein